MAFVTGTSIVLGAGVPVLLPVGADVGGNNSPFTLYSHMRVPGGTTYAFDSGAAQVVPTGIDSIVAIPVGARFITATAASTAQLGKSS
jgi:hypothetical protein